MFHLFKHVRRLYHIPGGQAPLVYDDMANQTHLLIAGKSGSGKSVVINGIIYDLLCRYTPDQVQFIFMDPKRVELISYKYTPHCLYYATEKDEQKKALQFALDITEERYQAMQQNRQKKYTGSQIFVVIDELADLMTTVRKDITPLLQRLAQIGRAANIHIIAATQCPLSKIIPTEIKVNFDAILALKTVSKQHSRNIIDLPGAETLPPYGYGYYLTPKEFSLVKLPMVSESEINRVCIAWEQQN